VREGDTVARFGGDEFVVILEDLDGSEVAALQAEAVALKIQERLRQVYLLEVSSESGSPHTHSHRCSSSVGVALYLDESVSAEELIKHADVAMYQAKSAGRDALRFFNPAMQAAVNARTGMENELLIAIDEQQFHLAYQIQVNESGDAVSTEALVRWNHPQRGPIGPIEFIQLAEDTGLIFPIGRWVIEEACKQLARWAHSPRLSELAIAVNVSARQFHDENFANQVIEILESTGANPKCLKLELTESLLAKNLDQVVVKMKTLKNIGVSFSLDDFGTGYSSLAYLKRLPIDELKIDKSFVNDLLKNPNDAVIARTVVSLGQSLGLRVIAEGVETAEQRDFLFQHGCKLFQGYHFGRPTSIAELESKILQ
jgi:EAL domain-containing protein (putative c-di-GMP-specific phosphodiesterase class I)